MRYFLSLVALVLLSCGRDNSNQRKDFHPPLVTNIYTADPSAHVFAGRVYIYASHDVPVESSARGPAEEFAMTDYHVLSIPLSGDSAAVDHGVALDIKDIPWARRNLWAPDAAFKDGQYYFYFPARDSNDVFHIGVATGKHPAGPFVAEPEPIPGTYSNDPAVFVDDNAGAFLLLGGIEGGQLQFWSDNQFYSTGRVPKGDERALGPRVARLKEDMKTLAEPLREILVMDSAGKELKARDRERRFFEGAWVHRFHGKYYLSYSTGDTHLIVYATSDSVYGPYTYGGIVLCPVEGWTTQHSIVQVDGKWYLFYHDSMLSGGKTNLRSVKYTELRHGKDGRIEAVHP